MFAMRNDCSFLREVFLPFFIAAEGEHAQTRSSSSVLQNILLLIPKPRDQKRLETREVILLLLLLLVLLNVRSVLPAPLDSSPAPLTFLTHDVTLPVSRQQPDPIRRLLQKTQQENLKGF